MPLAASSSIVTLSDANFARALELLVDVTRQATAAIDAVWPLIVARVLPRLVDAAADHVAQCAALLARLPVLFFYCDNDLSFVYRSILCSTFLQWQSARVMFSSAEAFLA